MPLYLGLVADPASHLNGQIRVGGGDLTNRLTIDRLTGKGAVQIDQVQAAPALGDLAEPPKNHGATQVRVEGTRVEAEAWAVDGSAKLNDSAVTLGPNKTAPPLTATPAAAPPQEQTVNLPQASPAAA